MLKSLLSKNKIWPQDWQVLILIHKHSTHGLGHLKGIDGKEWWRDILTIHYQPEQKAGILQKYGEGYAVSQLTVSNIDVLHRFDKLNEKKPLRRKIKPFNFVSVGTGYRIDWATSEPIIPMLPYSKADKTVIYKPFIDYKTGKQYPADESMETQFYWKPLSVVFTEYLEHPESKSDGDIGPLRRRHVKIGKRSIRYIGKESNEIEESKVVGVDDNSYAKYENINELIMSIRPNEAYKAGISRSSPISLQNKIKRRISIKLHDATVRKILAYLMD